jgi:FtsH-binding integral membrane protein
MTTDIQTLGRRGTTLIGQVFGLLAFSMAFTAGGATVAPLLGPSALSIGGLGALVTFAVLYFGRRLPSVLRLAVFYLFSIFQGITLGQAVRGYVAAGQGEIVALAAGTTGGLVLLLGGIAWFTGRDLRNQGGYLFAGLLGVLIASVVGIFVRAPLFHLVVAGATAIVFSGYLLYHIGQLKRGNGDAIGLAIAIYLDILNLFWALLRIINEVMRRRG